MSHVKILIHYVWGTNNREKLLVPEKKQLLINHIRKNASEKGIFIDTIDGHSDHLHCLVNLYANQNVDKVMQLIKGESSFWANKEKLFSNKLYWAEDYFAGSVSESLIDKVRTYINNQEAHHKKITFQEEYDMFIKAHGIKLG